MLVTYFNETQPDDPDTPGPPSPVRPLVPESSIYLPLIVRNYILGSGLTNFIGQ